MKRVAFGLGVAVLAAVACGSPSSPGGSAASGIASAASGATSVGATSSTSTGMGGPNCALTNGGNNCVCQWVNDMPVCVASDGKCIDKCPAMPCCGRGKSVQMGGSSEQCQCANLTGQDCDVKFIMVQQSLNPAFKKVASCP